MEKFHTAKTLCLRTTDPYSKHNADLALQSMIQELFHAISKETRQI